MNRKQAFTLVELLVVIAIISMLAALLLPALDKALWQARLTVCANNQRQIHLGLTFYYDEWENHLPAPWPRDNVPQCVSDTWYSVNNRMPMGLGILCARGYLEDASVLLCPDNIKLTAEELERLYYINTHDEFLPLVTSCSYVVNGVNYPYQSYTLAGRSALEWDNKVDYYAGLGIASKLQGNLPGGLMERDGAVKHLKSPRSVLACIFPSQNVISYVPHDMSCTNVLYADGVMAQCRFGEHPYMMDFSLIWKEKFKRDIDYSYPGYQAPK